MASKSNMSETERRCTGRRGRIQGRCRGRWQTSDMQEICFARPYPGTLPGALADEHYAGSLALFASLCRLKKQIDLLQISRFEEGLVWKLNPCGHSKEMV